MPPTSLNTPILHTVAAVSTVHRMLCSYFARLLRQHLPNPWHIPWRKTRAVGTGKHNHLLHKILASHTTYIILSLPDIYPPSLLTGSSIHQKDCMVQKGCSPISSQGQLGYVINACLNSSGQNLPRAGLYFVIPGREVQPHSPNINHWAQNCIYLEENLNWMVLQLEQRFLLLSNKETNHLRKLIFRETHRHPSGKLETQHLTLRPGCPVQISLNRHEL